MSNPKAIAIVPEGAGFKISITPEAVKLKQEALARAASIVKVTTKEEREAAIQAAGILKGLSSAAEATRKEIKQPYWDAGKTIDLKAKEYAADIDARVSAIERMLGAYAQAELDKARKEQQERERQQREAVEAQEREQRCLAEIERQQQEAQRQATEAGTAKERKAAQEAADKLERDRLAAEFELEEAQAANEEAQSTVVQSTAKVSGQRVKAEFDFEVTDIDAFYAWDLKRRQAARQEGRYAPTFVKMEIPKRDFKEFINSIDAEWHAQIPGVKITEQVTTKAKAIIPGGFLQ